MRSIFGGMGTWQSCRHQVPRVRLLFAVLIVVVGRAADAAGAGEKPVEVHGQVSLILLVASEVAVFGSGIDLRVGLSLGLGLGVDLGVGIILAVHILDLERLGRTCERRVRGSVGRGVGGGRWGAAGPRALHLSAGHDGFDRCDVLADTERTDGLCLLTWWVFEDACGGAWLPVSEVYSRVVSRPNGLHQWKRLCGSLLII